LKRDIVKNYVTAMSRRNPLVLLSGSFENVTVSRPTIADICLVAHLTSANMLCDSDPAPYPTARRILDACMQIEAFALEHPLRQAGAQTTAPL
jgi:glutathione S-transferase